MLEDVMAALRATQAENQRLRDESNRITGEQGAPKVTPPTPRWLPADHSSDQERHKPKVWMKHRKIDHIRIDRETVYNTITRN